MTLNQLRGAFWTYLNQVDPDLAKLRRSRKTQNDYPTDIRVAWCDFVDDASRRGDITEQQADNATL